MTPYDSPTLTNHPPYDTYRVWSERERQWIALTFE